MAYKERAENPVYYSVPNASKEKPIPGRDQRRLYQHDTIIGVHVSGSTTRGNMACELTPENIEWIEQKKAEIRSKRMKYEKLKRKGQREVVDINRARDEDERRSLIRAE